MPLRNVLRIVTPRSLAVALLAIALGLITSPDPAGALDGFLDRDFNAFGPFDFTGGVTLPLPPLTSGDVSAVAAKVQSDGRIVVLAQFQPVNTDNGFLLYRLLPSGTLDPAFGSGGIVIIDPDLGPTGFEFATDLAIQPDGKLLIAGSFDSAGGSVDWMVGRMLPEGTFDPNFNGGQWQTIAFDLGLGDTDQLTAMALDPDTGAIVLAGNGSVGSERSYAEVARLTPDGMLDPTFGAGGMGVGDFSPSSYLSHSAVTDVLVEPGGRVVLVGSVIASPTATSASRSFWVISRLTPSGFFDATFSQDGIALGDFSEIGGETSDAFLTSVARFSDGHYLAGGGYTTIFNGVPTAGLIRFDENGDPVTSWGINGYSSVVYNPTGTFNFLESLVVDAADRVVCAGAVEFGTTRAFVGFARLGENGFFDPRFINGGRSEFSFAIGQNANNQVAEVLLDLNGRILIAVTAQFRQPSPINLVQKRASMARLHGGVPFRDSFESGDFSGWTSVEGAAP